MNFNFNTSEQHAGPIVEIDTAPRVSTQEVRQAAEALVRREIIETRLKGDERGWNRWASNNAGFLRYCVGLKVAELGGVVASVQAADAEIARRREARTWRVIGGNSVISPDGVTMTLAKARRNGYAGS